MNTSDLNYKTLCSIVNHAIDKLNDGVGIDCYSCDLHSKLFNEDYFIIYHYRAKEWLKDCEIDTFDAIETVFEYEKDNFGEVTTAINPEAIVNMYAYIAGEAVLSESKLLSDKWDNRLTEKDCKKIVKELKSLL